MLVALPLSLFVLSSGQSGWEVSAQKAPIKMPFEVHSAVVKSLQDASEAQSKRDYQLSLALLHGVIYNDGVEVGIDSSGQSPNSAARQGLDQALATWEKSLAGDNPIRLVGASAKADVLIKFVEKVPRSGHDALGLIELKKKYSWNRSRYEIDIQGTIYIQTHFNRVPLTSAQYTEVIAHELGHLLGLDDLDQPGQLMGPMVLERPVNGPNARETYAVQAIRYQAKTQWNSVVELINSTQPRYSDETFLSYEREYLAMCTVGGRCYHGK